jgi:hypothetical protein
MENIEPNIIIDKLMRVLRIIYGNNIPNPNKFEITNWTKGLL